MLLWAASPHAGVMASRSADPGVRGAASAGPSGSARTGGGVPGAPLAIPTTAMSPAQPVTRDDLEAIVHECHHVHNENARASAESVRRKFSARLLELEQRFERALAEGVPDEGIRQAWRDYLHFRAPAPSQPPPIEPLLFRGRSEAGSEVVVRECADGKLEVAVDGSPIERVSGLDLASDGGTASLRVAGRQTFNETFGAPVEALEALRAWAERTEGEPPWEHLRALAADGLVDGHFGLTRRGRRAVSGGGLGGR